MVDFRSVKPPGGRIRRARVILTDDCIVVEPRLRYRWPTGWLSTAGMPERLAENRRPSTIARGDVAHLSRLPPGGVRHFGGRHGPARPEPESADEQRSAAYGTHHFG